MNIYRLYVFPRDAKAQCNVGEEIIVTAVVVAESHSAARQQVADIAGEQARFWIGIEDRLAKCDRVGTAHPKTSKPGPLCVRRELVTR